MMKTEYIDNIVEAFPRMFPNGLSIECGDGWREIIYWLCTQIHNTATINKIPIPEVHQIKEKFGGLRFYCTGLTDEMYEFVNKANEMCSVTCEVCGQSGKLVDDGWLMVRCEDHK